MIFPNEISETTNRVNALISHMAATPNRIDRVQAIAEALHLSCNLLTRLARDDIFLEYDRAVGNGNTESLRINRSLTGGAVQLVSMEFAHFEGFLQREVELLREANFDDEVVESLVQQIIHRIEHIRHYPTTGVELKRAVIRLQRYVCQQSERMTQALQSEHTRKHFILSLVGMGSISANILAVNFLSPVGIGASASIGGTLVAGSVKTLIDEVWSN
jgi:hypothetical protein